MAKFEFCVGSLRPPQVKRFNWDALPNSLKGNKVWGVYRASDKSICHCPGSHSLFKANDLNTALSFEQARQYAASLNAGLEFEDFGPMLFVTSNISIIDFDGTERPFHPDASKHWGDFTRHEREQFITREVKDTHYGIMQEAPTWVERSCSGKGYHAVYCTLTPSASTGVWKREWNIDIKGAPSFLFMTGDVVYENSGHLSVAGDWYGQAMARAAEDHAYQQMPLIPWYPETRTDAEVWAAMQKHCPGSCEFLLIDQVQGSLKGSTIGDQRFGALKDLIKYSLNREQVERMYLALPATQHHNRSPNRGRSEQSVTGYQRYLQKEIDRAALNLYQSDLFVPQADFSELLANFDRQQGIRAEPLPFVPVEQRVAVRVEFPPSTGMVQRFQNMLDNWQRVHPEISQASAISILCAIFGRRYFTRSITWDAQQGRLKATPRKDFVCLDYLVGAGANHGKSSAVTRFQEILGDESCQAWGSLVHWVTNTPELTRFSQFGTSMVSGAKFNRTANNLQDGGLILMDEVQGTMRGWVDKDYGGFGGQFNSLVTCRHPSGALAEVKKANEANNTEAVVAPAFSVFATGIPRDMLEVIAGSSMVGNGTLSRFVILNLGDASRDRHVPDAGGFDPEEFYANPVFTPDTGVMNMLNWIVEQDPTQPREVRLCRIDDDLVSRLLELSSSLNEELSPAFARTTDQAFKLSAVMAIMQNPAEPTHSIETLEWAYEYLTSAKIKSELWLSSRNIAIRSTQREFAIAEEIVEPMLKFIARLQAQTDEEHNKFSEEVARVWGANVLGHYVQYRSVTESMLYRWRNHYGFKIKNTNREIRETLNEVIRIAVDSKRLTVYVDGGVKYYQLVPEGVTV